MLQYRFNMARLFDVPPAPLAGARSCRASCGWCRARQPNALLTTTSLGKIVTALVSAETLGQPLRDFLDDGDFAALASTFRAASACVDSCASPIMWLRRVDRCQWAIYSLKLQKRLP